MKNAIYNWYLIQRKIYVEVTRQMIEETAKLCNKKLKEIDNLLLTCI